MAFYVKTCFMFILKENLSLKLIIDKASKNKQKHACD